MRTTTEETRMLIPVEEAARRLSIGRTIMYDLVMSGELATVKIGRRRLVPVKALDAYIASLGA
jgi:excisionase family DNA binding protein